ncbi:YbaK/EbsC family protein [Leucobacter coleopterorum]|uniref:YbaK/EbsC family protein n=1 Tax=Leucobacter coleopterorum TaxID=2714933 RepID=UPI0014088E6B|nr:YbaK/EbsC family protein [Leucobacter coleopterorum]
MTTSHVRRHLESFGWQGTILEFEESSATVELAAAQAGTEPRRIAKTLGFYDPENPAQAVLVVAAGDAKVNGGKFKREFGGKPRMLTGDDVLPLTGHPVGGVCPFAVADGTKIMLDVSLQRFNTVFPAAGTARSAVELAIPELEAFSGAGGWVDVCTGWQNEESASE